MAQWARGSEAAASLAQMATRAAKGDKSLSAMVRERQDLAGEWQKRDEDRIAAVSRSPERRDKPAEAANEARLLFIELRIGEIDKRLSSEYPDFFALANPSPSAVQDVQNELCPDEALILFLETPKVSPTPEETFIWVVTKTELRWVQSELGRASLTREVAALRCGLDAGRGRILAVKSWQAKTTLPPIETRANRYPSIMRAPISFIRRCSGGWRTSSRASICSGGFGPLTQLPFQVLVTAPPGEGDDKSAAWLIRDHALTVLPAVSSLKALRRVARPSAASQPMIGFGNPLLDGNQSHPKFGAYYKELAQRARDKQRCPETAWQRVASLFGLPRGVTPVQTRGAFADVDFLRMQVPLPETADELCAVARDIHADPGEIRLGERATEREVKRLSETGQLAQYRIVHFATHGALAGQVAGNSEPGLLLTPPAATSETDDGYLTASEIAGLKLDADWVILRLVTPRLVALRAPKRSPAWPGRSFMRRLARYSFRIGR